MILTLQCHLFDHTICNGNSTLYSKMGRISSISWGNGAQNYVCRHPVWRLYEVFSKFAILNYSSCFKLIPMILTLQCHLFDHTICNRNSTLYWKMGRISSISWGNGAQNYVCRHPVWRLYEVFSKFSILHYSSCFKLIPMILTLQCHLFDHIICNGNSTLYSKMGRILSISWGNGAQNYVCRHPVWRLFRIFFKFLILHILSCFKLIPMILTLQCHLFDHTICNGNSTLYSKMGRISSMSWGNGAQNYVCRHPVWRLYEVFSKFSKLHYSSCFKLIPMTLTLQCHLFHHTICNGNSTLYWKMGRISSISWGNGAQNYVCRHPVWRLYEVFSKFAILNYSSCFKLIPMILTLQCHLFNHTICNRNSTLYSKMGRILSISWGNGAQNYVCRHPVWRLYEVFSKFLILHYSSCFKLIPMILTLQCHLFDHTICSRNSTLYSKMGRILSILWGNGAQNYVCRHPVWRLYEVFSKFAILHYSSCFKLIPMILTLQCHLFDHIICNGNSTLYWKMGRISSISWGNGAQNYVCRHPVWRLYEVFSKFSILHYSSCFKLIPMILTLQCHLFNHTICNGNSTLYSKMGRILSISWGNGAQNYVCRHPVWRLYEVFSKFAIFHYSSCFKLIPMILTLQCHLIHHTICNRNSTLYSKMGRILSISWGNGAQNYVCRHPVWRLYEVFSKFAILHYSSCFKLIPMTLTLQCHLFNHTICNGNSTLYSKMGRILSISWGMGLKITFVDTRFGGIVKFFLSSQYAIIRHVSNLFR